MVANTGSQPQSTTLQQQKALTFPAPSVQKHVQQQAAGTNMVTSALTNLKRTLQQQQHNQIPRDNLGNQNFSQVTTSQSVSTPSLSPDSLFDAEMPLSPQGRRLSGSGGYNSGGSVNNQIRNFSTSPSTSSFVGTKEPSRRVGHIHAEQKRRYNIKNGFDMLHSLIPQLQQNPNAKVSFETHIPISRIARGFI